MADKLTSRIEYLGVQFLAWKMRILPFRCARLAAGLLGCLAGSLLGIRKKVALDNLQQAYPEKSEGELRQIYLGCWRHFMKVGAEMARLPKIDEKFIERWINLDAQTVMKEVLSRGKGAIVVSGHFGNWEWMGGGMARVGYPVTYVVTSQTNRLVEDWMNRMRESVGIQIVSRRNAVKGVLSALKDNRAVAMLCDQDAGEAGVFVPFFGRSASTPRGPALFHLKTGAPIVFGSARRDENGIVRLIFEEMKFEGPTGDREQDEIRIMTQITARLEKEIRRHPEQWLWLHRRWKSSLILL